MKSIVTVLFSIFITIQCFATKCGDVVYEKADSVRICSLLEDAKQQPVSTNWMMYFARKFMGVPYVGGTLDKDTYERLVVNLRELDCTTFVETITALSMCASKGETSFDKYCDALVNVRYIDGNVDYCSRQHYFTLWMEANSKQQIVQIIEPSCAPFTATQVVRTDYMSTHVGSYNMLKAHPQWLNGIKRMEEDITGKTVRYIPKSALKATVQNNKLLRKYIHDGDILAIVTSIKGLDTTHIGIASWHSDGLHLVNASSIHKKVVDEPMLLHNYMQKHPSQQGIRVCRVIY